MSTGTADMTGKFVLTASHCSTEAHLAGVPFPRSFLLAPGAEGKAVRV